MKLTVDLSLLQQAVIIMGAEKITYEPTTSLIPTKKIDRDLFDGLEVNFKDIEFDTGLASYKGRQVLLYIKDHSYNNKIYSVLDDGSKGNKYHVADCSKLDEMRRKGRFERYVVTNKLDGIFAVSGNDKHKDILIEGESKLSVCQYCLESINYNKFTSIPRGIVRRTFVQNFELADFFETYSSFFKFMPKGIADSSASYYSNDWKLISNKVRTKFNFQCQQCGLDLNNYKRLLHVHHINAVKSDNSSVNLTPLCCDCHRKQPDHKHIFINHEDTQLISTLRRAQGLNVRKSWLDVYKLADPGMHGVIDVLEKYHLSLPEISYIVKNNKKESEVTLELAWPFKKVAIAIDKPQAIAATKQGWKVYSMRHALSQIDELAQRVR